MTNEYYEIFLVMLRINYLIRDVNSIFPARVPLLNLSNRPRLPALSFPPAFSTKLANTNLKFTSHAERAPPATQRAHQSSH